MTGDNCNHAFHNRDVVFLGDGLVEDRNESCLVFHSGETPLPSKRPDLGSRSLGRRLELPLFRQGVTKGGFGACVYAGAGSGAGSATEIIFFGVDMPRVFRISPRLSGIFVR